MKRLNSHLVGVDHGELMLFSDFEDEGEMWTGTGPRERRATVRFSEPYRASPVVQASVSLWDVNTQSAMRGDLITENVTRENFDVVFRTWGDSRFARLRVNWMAIGELLHGEEWELY